MTKSKAYALLKADIIKITGLIPEGRVTTFKAIGVYLDVMPSHVAYILSRPDKEPAGAYPWQRVVDEGGKLGKPKFDGAGVSQRDLLKDEGVRCSKSAVTDFDAVFIGVDELGSDVVPRKRYLID